MKMRKRQLISPQYSRCFSTNDLWSYKLGTGSGEKRNQIDRHLNLEKCRRCRSHFLSLMHAPDVPVSVELLPSPPLRDPEPSLYQPPEKGPRLLETGQVWTTLPRSETPEGGGEDLDGLTIPVVIVEPGDPGEISGNAITVLPLTIDTDFHFAPSTFLLSEADCSLGFEVLVEFFNEIRMSAACLFEYHGMLGKTCMSKVRSARSAFLKKGTTVHPPGDIVEWQEREIHITRHLQTPVAISLAPYREAADTTGIELSEIRPHILIRTGGFSLALVQQRDQVLLEFSTTGPRLQHCRIEGETVTLRQKYPGVSIGEIGRVGLVTGRKEITARIGGRDYTFRILFLNRDIEDYNVR